MNRLYIIKNGDKIELELDQNEDIEISYDIKNFDIDKRNTSFTKSFNLPSTTKNNNFFEMNYIANNSFNDVDYQCELNIDGSSVIRGILHLNSIKVDKYGLKTAYEVEIVSTLYNLISKYGDRLLVGNDIKSWDLDFIDMELDADYSQHQMEKTWSGTCDTDYYVYAPINLGYVWDRSVLQGNNSNTFWYMRRNSVGMFPHLYVKTIYRKLCQKYNLNIKSSFFDSDIFNKMIIYNCGDIQNNGNFFQYTEGPLTGQTFTYYTQPFIEFGYNNSPTGSTIINNNEFITPSGSNNGWNFNLTGYFTSIDPSNLIPTWANIGLNTFEILAFKYDPRTGQWVSVSQYPVITKKYGEDGQSIAFDGTIYIPLNPGEKVAFWLNISFPPITMGVTNFKLENFSINITSDQKSITAKNMIPQNMTVSSFLTSLFKMFNLLIYDKNGDTYIETYNDFYNTNEILNLTDIVDRSSYELTPLSSTLPPFIEFKYADGQDDKNKRFKDRYNSNYGDAVISIGGRETQNQTVEPQITYTQYRLEEGLPIPYVFSTSEDTTINNIDGGLRYAFYNGLQTFYPVKIDGNMYNQIPITSQFYQLQNDSQTLKFGPSTNEQYDKTNVPYGLTSNKGLIDTYYGEYLNTFDKNDYQVKLKINMKFNSDFDMNTKVYLNLNGIPRYYRIINITFSTDESVLSEITLTPLSNNINYSLYNSFRHPGTSILKDSPNTDFVSYGNNTNGGIGNSVVGNNNDIINSDFINVIGNSNILTTGSTNINIYGNDNAVGNDSKNILIIGDGAVIPNNTSNKIYVNGTEFQSGNDKLSTNGGTMNGNITFSNDYTIQLASNQSGPFILNSSGECNTDLPFDIGRQMAFITFRDQLPTGFSTYISEVSDKLYIKSNYTEGMGSVDGLRFFVGIFNYG